MIRSIAALAAVAFAFALTPIAAAQEDVTPRFSLGGTTFAPWSEFKVEIEKDTCPGGPVSITSTGFSNVDVATLRGSFHGVPGTFEATLRCKDTTKPGTVTYQLQLPPRPRFLDKTEYAPGETIKVRVEGHSFCPSVESSGFVAPIYPPNNPGGSAQGEGKAIDTPGTYEAKASCYKYQTYVDTFTIKAPPANPTTNPTTNPKAPPAKPKPPIVKPKGAPQTGAGGTSR